MDKNGRTDGNEEAGSHCISFPSILP